jgi:hypothetical protein
MNSPSIDQAGFGRIVGQHLEGAVAVQGHILFSEMPSVLPFSCYSSRPVLDRLGDMRRLDGLAAGQVGDGACQLEHPMVSAGAEGILAIYHSK